MVKTCLVLNATYEPLSIVSHERAIVLVFLGKAEVLEDTGDVISSANEAIMKPLVVRMLYMVHASRKRVVPLSRKALFTRDKHTCQYCGADSKDRPLEVEHVIPRSRGGRNVWENVVAACRQCNGHKSNRTPQEAGMVLRSKPYAPTHYNMVAARGIKAWEKYLSPEEQVA